MRITVLTLFPEMYESFLSTSIIGRALKRELVTVDFVQIRDFALDKFKQSMILHLVEAWDKL